MQPLSSFIGSIYKKVIHQTTGRSYMHNPTFIDTVLEKSDLLRQPMVPDIHRGLSLDALDIILLWFALDANEGLFSEDGLVCSKQFSLSARADGFLTQVSKTDNSCKVLGNLNNCELSNKQKRDQANNHRISSSVVLFVTSQSQPCQTHWW